jgi:hypothetical protein
MPSSPIQQICGVEGLYKYSRLKNENITGKKLMIRISV